jgi:hypothetical protein
VVAAALGYLTPVEAALIQAVIDVAVITNTIRALRGRNCGNQPPVEHQTVHEPTAGFGAKLPFIRKQHLATIVTE